MERTPERVDLRWLRLDLSLFKHELVALAMKWIYVHCRYLAEQVARQLAEFDHFLQRIEPELDRISGPTSLLLTLCFYNHLETRAMQFMPIGFCQKF